jgi:CheY-like chemotaxis protein
MRVLLAHALTPKRRRIARVLAEAGHEVTEVAGSDEALALCRDWAPDVAVVHADCSGDLVCEIKSDPVAYATAIVMISRPGGRSTGSAAACRTSSWSRWPTARS